MRRKPVTQSSVRWRETPEVLNHQTCTPFHETLFKRSSLSWKHDRLDHFFPRSSWGPGSSLTEMVGQTIYLKQLAQHTGITDNCFILHISLWTFDNMTPCDIQQRVSTPWRVLGLSPHYFRGQRCSALWDIEDGCVGGKRTGRRYGGEIRGKNNLKQAALEMETH